jgi:outer membrane receptor for ferrienterochelin and colicins
MGAVFTRENLARSDVVPDLVFIEPYPYIQYDGQYFEKLNVVVGARFDEHNAYRSQLSPKAAIRYGLSKKIGLKASVGYGYKAPDFRQLYFNFTNPAGGGYIVLGQSAVGTRLPELFENGGLASTATEASVNATVARFSNQLKAESSINFNFGLDYSPKENIQLNVNLFRNDVENLIDVEILPIPTSGGANIFSYVNRNNVYTQGIELDAKWRIVQNIRIAGGYQLLYAYDREQKESAEANPGIIVRDPESLESVRVDAEYFGLPNRSRHMANFKVFFDLPKWDLDANIRGTYRSKYGLTDTNGNGYLDDFDPFVKGYSIWDVAFNKGIKEHFTIGFGIDNLLDFTDPVNISNVPGRLIYGKLNYKF